jgi:hypothetical protein
MLFKAPIFIVSVLRQKHEVGKRISELQVNEDDVLILLDSSWHSDLFRQVEALKSKGVGVISIIYDLIPLTHSHFCDDSLVVSFEEWFAWVPQIADGFVAISKTIRDQVKDYVEKSSRSFDLSTKWCERSLSEQSGLSHGEYPGTQEEPRLSSGCF